MHSLFPIGNYWALYLGLLVLIFAVLSLDLFLVNRTAHTIRFREALLSTLGWMLLTGCFGGFLVWMIHAHWPELQSSPFAQGTAAATAKTVALEFFTGYFVEQSLAFDNLFVFSAVFTYFQIPPKYQHRVLFWGFIGAVGCRGLFIALASFLLKLKWVNWVFGGLLLLTGFKIFFTQSKAEDLETKWLIRLLKKALPIHPRIEGQEFIVKKDSIWKATPLLLALIFLEMSDVVFSIDSVPAIFAITKDPFIVFSSNLFAVLGLRSAYFLIASAVLRFHTIHYGLGIVLVFVGLKMSILDELVHPKFPTSWSLLIILGSIGGAVAYSFIAPARSEAT